MLFDIDINLINAILIIIFALPVITGIAAGFSKNRVMRSFASVIENLELIVGIYFVVYLTGKIFFSQDPGFFKDVYGFIPSVIRQFLLGKDVLIYLLSVPLLLLLILSLARLLTAPLYKWLIMPLSVRFYNKINSTGGFIRRFFGGLWEIPRSILFVLLFSLLLNFASYFVYSPILSKNLTDSTIYGFIYDNALNPVLNSSFARKIPVLVNDSFKEAMERFRPDAGAGQDADPQVRDTGSRIRVIEYFNGVTLEDAVESNAGIDDMALAITKNFSDGREKAYAIYSWISKNIRYDFDKAEKIATDPSGISSGSIVAFNERKGVCFDYSCLFVSMCNAAGLDSRLVTGLGYSGNAWGDHAWNQVHYDVENRWIDVDATFGSSGLNYFDKTDFESDHKYADVQGEWLWNPSMDESI